MHGGPVPLPPPFTDEEIAIALNSIKYQAIQQDPKRVIAKGFPAAGSATKQLSDVGKWLDEKNRDCDSPAKVVLIGHSYGGDAVRQANFSNMCSRITIDPINPDLIWPLLIFNQRDYAYDRVNIGVQLINVLASSDEWNGLLGYQIVGATEWIENEPPTNHETIITRVLEKNTVADEVQRCLE